MTASLPLRGSFPSFASRVVLGGTGYAVSRVCIGVVDEPQVVVDAHRLGINFFFISCDLHWPKYENTVRGLMRVLEEGACRRDIVVAAVSYSHGRNTGAAAVDDLLEAYPTLKWADLHIIGAASATSFIERFCEYEDLVREGSVRGLGTDFVSSRAFRTCIRHGIGSVAFAPVTPSANGWPVVEELMDATSDPKVAVYARGIMGSTPDELREHLRFALSLESVAGVVLSRLTRETVALVPGVFETSPLDVDEFDAAVRSSFLTE